jgi:hypothetical protein
VFAVLVLAVFVSSVAAAQTSQAGEAHERRGFWIAFGFGAGSGRTICTSYCVDTTRVGGATGRFAMGGTASAHLKIGGEAHGWVNMNDPALLESIGNVTVSAYYYPSATGNLFLQGGLGYSAYADDDLQDKREAHGVATILGVGYDIYVGRSFSLTPILAWGTAWTGEVQLNGSGTGDTFRPSFLSLTLSPTWH